MTDPGCAATRHGDRAAYQAGCRCEPARWDAARYQKGRVFDRDQGRPRTVDATGTRRRMRALVRLGWSFVQLGAYLGIRGEAARQLAGGEAALAGRERRCWSSTRERVKAMYDELSMKLPPEDTHRQRQIASRTRNYAERQGWDPVLAWDEESIDDPAAVPHNPKSWWDESSVDHAVVERMVTGGERPPRKLTHAEAAEVVRRLLGHGHSGWEIEHHYGLKPERYRSAS